MLYGQVWHESDPGNAANVFIGQILHAVPPDLFTYIPALHWVQFAMPDVLVYAPGGHSEAAVAPEFDTYDPAVHARHTERPEMLVYVPALHWVQVVAPEIEEYVPDRQVKAADAPETVVYVPAVHTLHEIIPPSDQVPALHIEHEVQLYAAYPIVQAGAGLQHACAT
jgi:hypothetical protein